MSAGQVGAGGTTIHYTVTWPALPPVAAIHARLATAFAALAAQFQAQAQAAYRGTRFAPLFTVTSSWQHVALTQPHPLFAVVEWPTRPHPIRPVRGQYLRFVIGGRVIYARAVQHPGTRGRQAIDPLFQQLAIAFAQAIQQVGGEVLRGAV